MSETCSCKKHRIWASCKEQPLTLETDKWISPAAMRAHANRL